MSKKIFRSIMLVAMIVLLTSLAFVMGILYDYFEKQIQSELKSEAAYAARGIEGMGVEYIDNFETGEKRITLIAADGTVLADNDVDPATLDNHADRKEVKQALESGSGTSVRYSKTLTKVTVYYAMLLDDGNVLRICTTRYSIVAMLLGLIHPLLIVLVAAFIISTILSHRITKSITNPINSIDLDNPTETEAYEELTPLLDKIAAQNKTIRRQIKEAEKKREEFRLITENMNEGFLVIDSQTNVLTYNKAALRLLGIDEVRRGSVLALNRTEGFRDVVNKALAGERAENEINVDKRSYSLIANPALDGGKVIGAVIVIIDVTERVERDRLRREFTSNVSHELKTPLTSISGFAEIMKDGGTPEETVVDFSKSIYDEARRLVTLVNDIIKISEFDEKNVPYEKENVDLVELARSVAAVLKPAADKKHVTISVAGEGEIHGVRSILEEIVYNLCDNAVKYNRDGGRVEVALGKNGDKTTLTVADTGIGIPFADRDRVFERFYRVEKSHSKALGGTGLGLSIVKHAVIYHGGEISLESTEGKGTTVTVEFPTK